MRGVRLAAGYEVKQRFMIFTAVNARNEVDQVVLRLHGRLDLLSLPERVYFFHTLAIFSVFICWTDL